MKIRGGGKVAGTEITLGNSPLMDGFDSMWEVILEFEDFFSSSEFLTFKDSLRLKTWKMFPKVIICLSLGIFHEAMN